MSEVTKNNETTTPSEDVNQDANSVFTKISDNLDPDAIQDRISKAEQYLEKNLKIVFAVVGAIVLAVGGYFGFNWYIGEQNAEAQSKMFQAVYYFEADSLNKALKGDKQSIGLVRIADDYGMTKAGKLAALYAGTAYLKLGKFTEAVDYLGKFSSNDLLLQARAYSLMGDAYMEQKKFSDAVEYYSKAVSYKPTKEFTPAYILKLALAQEKNNAGADAIKSYEKLISEYGTSQLVDIAKKYKGLQEEKLN